MKKTIIPIKQYTSFFFERSTHLCVQSFFKQQNLTSKCILQVELKKKTSILVRHYKLEKLRNVLATNVRHQSDSDSNGGCLNTRIKKGDVRTSGEAEGRLAACKTT